MHSATKANVTSFVADNIEPGSIVYADQHPSYRDIKDQFAHTALQHQVGEYVVGDATTNTVESFWALLKRGHYGTYHQWRGSTCTVIWPSSAAASITDTFQCWNGCACCWVSRASP